MEDLRRRRETRLALSALLAWRHCAARRRRARRTMAEFPPGVSGSEHPWPSSDPPAAAGGSILRRMEETEEMFRKQEIADRFVNFSTIYACISHLTLVL